MTVAPPFSSSHQASGNLSSAQQGVPTKRLSRRRSSLLQESIRYGQSASFSTRSSSTSSEFLRSFPRSNSLSGISRVVVLDRSSRRSSSCSSNEDSVSQYGYEPTTFSASSGNTGNTSNSLQGSDKRRRYKRRGSKTSFMMRGSTLKGASSAGGFPESWRTSLDKCIGKLSGGNKGTPSGVSCYTHGRLPDYEDDSCVRTVQSMPQSSAGSDTISYSSSTCLDMSTRVLDVLPFSPEGSSQAPFNKGAHNSTIVSPTSTLCSGAKSNTILSKSLTTNKQQATMSLLASALELSCIDDEAALDEFEQRTAY